MPNVHLVIVYCGPKLEVFILQRRENLVLDVYDVIRRDFAVSIFFDLNYSIVLDSPVESSRNWLATFKIQKNPTTKPNQNSTNHSILAKLECFDSLLGIFKSC